MMFISDESKILKNIPNGLGPLIFIGQVFFYRDFSVSPVVKVFHFHGPFALFQ